MARRELDEFWKAAEQQGGIRVRDRSRVFKVLKTPVPLENTPNELRALLGYEFFRIDQETGRSGSWTRSSVLKRSASSG